MTAVDDRTRTLLWQRAGFRCEGCGHPGTILDPHHRQPRGMGGVHGLAATKANDIRNFLALCRVCHDAVDAQPLAAQRRGLLVPHPIDSFVVPCLIFTVNGYGWWVLTDDAGYTWVDEEDALVTLNLYGLA